MMLLFLRTDAYYSVARVVSWDAECKGVFSDAFSFFFLFFIGGHSSLDYRECKDEGRRFMAVVGRGCWSLLIGDGGGGGGGRWTRGGG